MVYNNMIIKVGVVNIDNNNVCTSKSFQDNISLLSNKTVSNKMKGKKKRNFFLVVFGLLYSIYIVLASSM